MKLTSIEFRGFGRLLDTKCNVDGKIIALVGKNEAGKSSALEGLEWLTKRDGDVELPIARVNRADTDSVNRSVVVASFALNDDDRDAALDALDTTSKPTRLRVSRHRDGSVAFDLEPRVQRSTSPRIDLEAALTKYQSLEDIDGEPAVWSEVIRKLVDDPDASPSEDEFESLEALREWLLQEPDPPGELEEEPVSSTDPWVPSEEERVLADAIRDYTKQMRSQHPHELASKVAWNRSPDFLLFREQDRNLAATYNLGDPALQAEPPAALANLLAVQARAWTNSKLSLRWEIRPDGNSVCVKSMSDSTTKSRLTGASHGCARC